MASTITNYSTNIDTTFPMPGVDNDTAGFRNNFAAIKNALTVASGEISVIQQQPITNLNWARISNKPIFATVSTSGSYFDLADRPILNTGTYVPTVVSAFQNDSGYVSTTSAYWTTFQSVVENVQSQTSDIVNDIQLDSIEANAIPLTNNILQLTTASLATHFVAGQSIRIFGASTGTAMITESGTINSVSLNGFSNITGTSVFRYKVAQFNLSTGNISAASAETVIANINLVQFNLTNNVGVNITRSSTDYGILLYRQTDSGGYQLIATLGSKNFVGNLNTVYLDYYDFDYTSWSRKSIITNDFQATSGLIHMPVTAPGTPSNGWVSTTIIAVNSSNGTLTLSSSFYMNLTVIVSHDDTMLIQNAVNKRSANNLNSLRLGSKNYIISNITLPAGFKLYGQGRPPLLKKLSWSSTDQTTNKMISTVNNTVLNLISIDNVEIDGNMQNQYLLDSAADTYINYCVDIKGTTHSFNNLNISNVIGGGLSSTGPTNLMITNCHIEGGGLSDRDDYSPIIADDGSNILITNNLLKNFPSSFDASLTATGIVNGNIVSNCGSGILTYGSTNLIAASNVILGPAGEYIPGPDVLNSEFDAVNVVLDSDTDYLSDMYVYQENGAFFNLTANNGVLTYKVEKLRKVNNVEELYGEVKVQDPSTSTVQLVCPLFPIINTDLGNGQFRFLITAAGVNSLTNYYSYSNLHAIDPNHVGLVYKALLTEHVPCGIVTSATFSISSVPVSFIQVQLSNTTNLAIGSTVSFSNFGGTPSLDSIEGIIRDYNPANKQWTIDYPVNITAPGNISTNPTALTQITRKNTFILAKGRIQ